MKSYKYSQYNIVMEDKEKLIIFNTKSNAKAIIENKETIQFLKQSNGKLYTYDQICNIAQSLLELNFFVDNEHNELLEVLDFVDYITNSKDLLFINAILSEKVEKDVHMMTKKSISELIDASYNCFKNKNYRKLLINIKAFEIGDNVIYFLNQIKKVFTNNDNLEILLDLNQVDKHKLKQIEKENNFISTIAVRLDHYNIENYDIETKLHLHLNIYYDLFNLEVILNNLHKISKFINSREHVIVKFIYDKENCEMKNMYNSNTDHVVKDVLIEESKKLNIPLPDNDFLHICGLMCVAANPDFINVDTDGIIRKCSKDLTENIVGNITGGNFNINETSIELWNLSRTNIEKNDSCLKCKLLPLCLNSVCPNQKKKDEKSSKNCLLLLEKIHDRLGKELERV